MNEARDDRWRRDILLMVAVFLLYVITGKAGLRLAFVHANATAVWAPSGVALAAFLLFGVRLWPAVLAGAFVVNVTTAASVAVSASLALGNTLEGLIAAYLVNRFAGGRSVFRRPQDIFKFAWRGPLPRRWEPQSASPPSRWLAMLSGPPTRGSG